jgi:hypothetical protein
MPKPGSPGVYYDGKSAIHASFTPQGNHSFVMVEEEFDGRPFQVRFPLQPETMIAKGNWPIDGTISISDFGRLSQHPDQRQSISLDLNQAHRDLEFTVFLYDESGNRLDLLSSGSQLDKAGYPVSYWWQSEGTDKATSFEVWQGKAVNVEFSGIVIPASNLN